MFDRHFLGAGSDRSSIRWTEPLDRTGFSLGFDRLRPAYRRLERGGVDDLGAELGAELRDEERGAECGAGREDRGDEGGTEMELEDRGAAGAFRPDRGHPSASEFDAARFHALVERFATSLRSALRRYLPEQDLGDVLHDAVVCAYAHADQLPADPEAALKDLVRIGFTVADSVRRRTRLASLRFLTTGELLADVPDPREVAQWVEDRLIAFNALRAVDQPYRGVLELHLFDELGHLEIAKEMGISPGTARTWLWRGKSELAAAARPKRRKAGRRALVIPLGFGELDPMDRALFRALRDATRGDPAFGGGDGGPPPRSGPQRHPPSAQGSVLLHRLVMPSCIS